MNIDEKAVAINEAVALTDKQKDYVRLLVLIFKFFDDEIKEFKNQSSIETATGVYLDRLGEYLGISRKTDLELSYEDLKDDNLFRELIKVRAWILWNGLSRNLVMRLARILGLSAKLNVFLTNTYITYCFHSLTQTELDDLKSKVKILKLFKFGRILEVNATLATSFRFNVSFGKLAEKIYKEY